MKRFLLFLFIISFLSVFIGCKKTDINEIWFLENSLDFSKSFDDNKSQIEQIERKYQLLQNKNKKWENGYIQQIQFYVMLYYRGLIDKERFIQKVDLIYFKYLKVNKLNDNIVFSYAILNYLKGEIKVCNQLLESIYDEKMKYYYEQPDNTQIKNLVAGLMLKKIKAKQFENTAFESFLRLEDNQLIEMLQVTW